MDHGFGIDTAFKKAIARWRAAVNGEAVLTLTLRGEERDLIPRALEISTPSGTIEIDVGDWAGDLPRTREALREDARVWELFATEWSTGEIRNYLGLDDTAPQADVRAAFVKSEWWREFEHMVALAFAYEWRAALDELARPWKAGVVIAHPTPDDSSLADYEQRLSEAASRFEASTFDARLLYDGSTRKAAFIIHTSEVDIDE